MGDAVMEGGSGESTSEESSLPSSSYFKRHQHPTFETATFAIYPADVTDLRQWGLVKKFEDELYGDCVKTPS